MSEIELQNQALEEQNARMFKELRAGEEAAGQVPGLKRTIEQYKKQVARLEAEYAEATRIGGELEAEKQMLLSKSDGAEYQKTKDQERIRNLEEKIRELESGVISENVDEYGGDLGSEITFATKTKSDMLVTAANNAPHFVADEGAQETQDCSSRGRNPTSQGQRRRWC